MILPQLRHMLLAGHRKGHGIHSPFLYHLVNQAIFNNNRYYCFDNIEHLYPTTKKGHTLGQILFKLAEDINATTLLAYCDDSSVDLAYLMLHKAGTDLFFLTDKKNNTNSFDSIQAAKRGCNCQSVFLSETNPSNNAICTLPKIDLAFVDSYSDSPNVAKWIESILGRMHNNSLLIIKHIHKKQMEPHWNAITHHPLVTVSLDVYHFGILLFRPDLEKKHYLIRR